MADGGEGSGAHKTEKSIRTREDSSQTEEVAELLDTEGDGRDGSSQSVAKSSPSQLTSTMQSIILTDLHGEELVDKQSDDFSQSAEGKYTNYLKKYSRVHLESIKEKSWEDVANRMRQVLELGNASKTLILIICYREARIFPKMLLDLVKNMRLEGLKLIIQCEVSDSDTPTQVDSEPHKVPQKSRKFRSKYSEIFFLHMTGSRERIRKYIKNLKETKERLWYMRCIATIHREAFPVTDTGEGDYINIFEGFNKADDMFTRGDPVTRYGEPRYLLEHVMGTHYGLHKLRVQPKDDFYCHSIEKQGKPLALIVDNVTPITKEETSDLSSLADRENLQSLLKQLRFDVFVCCDESAASLETTVKHFASHSAHGPSAVLIVLSELASNGEINCPGGQSIAKDKLLELMYAGDKCKVKDKPRLVIFHTWQKKDGNGEPDANDSPKTGLGEFYGNAKKLKVEPFHEQRGLIVADSETPEVNDEGRGSRFILALCHTFRKFAAEQDVVAMTTKINHIVAHELPADIRKLEDGTNRNKISPPTWWVQTDRLLFLVDTSRIPKKTKSPENIKKLRDCASLLPDHTGKDATDEKKGNGGKDSIAGRALFLVGHDDAGIGRAVADSVAFLACCGFEVSEEFNDDVSRIDQLRDCSTSAVCVVVVKLESRSRIQQHLEAFNDFEASNKLLIVCCVSEGGSVRHEIPDLDNCCNTCIVQKTGAANTIAEFLQDIVKYADKNCKPNSPLTLEMLRNAPLNTEVKKSADYDHSKFPENVKPIKTKPLKLKNLMREEETLNTKNKSLQNPKHLELLHRSQADSQPLEIKSYPLDLNPKPRVLIIGNVVFKGKAKEQRPCTVADCANLMDVFWHMQFRVTLKLNLDKDRMEAAVKEFANSSDHGRCCVLVVMSHGSMGTISGAASGEPVQQDSLLQYIRGGTYIKDKPKLVIFQSCRNDTSPQRPTSTDGQSPQTQVRQDVHSHMVVGYSTSPGDVSLRRSRGSRFIMALCFVLYERANKEDVVSMIPRVNNFMTEEFGRANPDDDRSLCQLPQWQVETEKLFYLVGEVGDASDDSGNAGAAASGISSKASEVLDDTDAAGATWKKEPEDENTPDDVDVRGKTEQQEQKEE